MNELPPLTPNGVAILSMMNGDYRRKIIKVLEQHREDWDHLDTAVQVIDSCLAAIRQIDIEGNP